MLYNHVLTFIWLGNTILQWSFYQPVLDAYSTHTDPLPPSYWFMAQRQPMTMLVDLNLETPAYWSASDPPDNSWSQSSSTGFQVLR